MGKQIPGVFGDISPENSLMHERKPDFSGWATRANLKCSDGRTILPGAFKHQDKARIPLVWQHTHNDPGNVLGHAVLEDRDEGTYCYGFFNDTPQGENAKTLVEHKDITALSIFANQLVEKAKNVSHGIIRELSLVLAGANPGALIDNLELEHGDGGMVTLEDEAVIYTGELIHEDGGPPKGDLDDPAEEKKIPSENPSEDESGSEGEDEESGEEGSAQHVYDSLNDEQKELVHYMVGEALESSEETPVEHSGAGNNDQEEDTRTMSRNVFEQQNGGGAGGEGNKHSLSHDDVRGIAAAAVKTGSLKEAVEDYALEHGIEDIEILFPEARNVTQTPEFDKRRTEWVASVWNGTRKSPFSRIKSIVADITHEEARARGYIKGNLKKEEFFGLAKRVTTPTTVYKKQKLDRDDIIDITDFDVVLWMKGEMRLMLEEELARAILIGDGREVGDDDKIRDPAGASEGAGIRAIANDHDLYAATVNVNLDDADSSPIEIIDTIVRNMRLYKGSGSPVFYTTLPVITQLLLARDTLGRRLYRTQSDLAAEMGVSSIVPVEVMEGESDLVGIIVNLQDYNIGADRGGEVAMFDDFDIDYNQYKYLMETRISGALIKIRSALVLRKVASDAELVDPASPGFNESNGNITIVDQTGVVYRRADTNAVVNAAGSPYNLTPGQSRKITAEAASGYYFEDNVDDEWTFTREA